MPVNIAKTKSPIWGFLSFIQLHQIHFQVILLQVSLGSYLVPSGRLKLNKVPIGLTGYAILVVSFFISCLRDTFHLIACD